MRLRRITTLMLSLCLTASLLAGAALAVDGEEYIATKPECLTGGYGMDINGHFTYCVNRELAWPDAGTRYEMPENDGLDDETRALIARALDAGFPSDLFGLTRLEPTLPEDLFGMTLADYYATATQFAIWYALGDETSAIPVEESAFSAAVYNYAVTGVLPEGYTDPVDTVNVSVPDQVELTWDAKRECFVGQVAFTANKAAELNVIEVPENVTLQVDGVDVRVGDKLYVNQVLSATAENEVEPKGQMAFTYISYERVKESTVKLFAPLDKPNDQTGKDAYQNMMGYEMEGVELDPGVRFILGEKPVEPTPPDPEEPGTPTPDPDPKPDPEPTPSQTLSPTPSQTPSPSLR